MFLSNFSDVSQLRNQWADHRDVAIQHISACSNAVQENTYLAGTAQEQFESNWEVLDDDPTVVGSSSTNTYTVMDNNDDLIGSSHYNPLARATSRARATCRRTRDKEHQKLIKSLQSMTEIVSQLIEIYNKSKAEYHTLLSQDKSWETCKIGLTWCYTDALHVLHTVVESYRTELCLKACIVDDVLKQTEVDVLLAYVATFLSEPYIDENAIFASLEAAKYDLSNK